MRLRWVLVVIMLTGCASTGSPPEAAQSPDSPLATQTQPTAAVVYEAMDSAVRAAGTGTFVQRTTTHFPDGDLRLVLDGRYNLDSNAWAARLFAETDSDALRTRMPDLEVLSIDLIVVGFEAYMNSSGWPEQYRGRWLAFSPDGPSGLEQVDAVASLGMPYAMSALFAVTAERVEQNAAGSVLTGAVPAEHALGAMNVKSGLAKMGIDMTAIEGTATTSVTVDANGLPSLITIDGATVDISEPTLPASLTEALPALSVSITLDKFGEPVEVSAPQGEQIIDPSKFG